MKTIVLLSSYNGEKFIKAQLDSIIAQTAENVEILVRDDGSADNTLGILSEYSDKGHLNYYTGRNIGAAASFWELLQKSGDADYYAFCDQDDVWDSDKLEKAQRCLSDKNAALPLLYCGDVRVADSELNVLSDTMTVPERCDYPFSLIKNIAPGCTFVFNRRAKEVLCRYDARKLGIYQHDWLAYQIVSCFGEVCFDREPHMYYRQHDNNVIGAVKNIGAERIRKAFEFMFGRKKHLREQLAKRLLSAYTADMNEENRELTEMIADYRKSTVYKKRILRADEFKFNGIDHLFFRLLIIFDLF